MHGSFVKSVYVHALTSSELTVLVEYNADTPSRARIEVVAEGVAGTVHSDSLEAILPTRKSRLGLIRGDARERRLGLISGRCARRLYYEVATEGVARTLWLYYEVASQVG